MITSKNIRNQNILQLAAILIGIIAVNIIGRFYYERFDLTSEKRFSVSPSTKEIIQNLDDFIYIKVYLEGDLPPGFKRLRNSTRELLDEFRAHNKNVMYEFINPSENENKKERLKVYQSLVNEGLDFYDIPMETKDGFAQKTIFPSALISYQEKTIAVNLLAGNRKVPSDADLNLSVQNLELNMLNSIRKISQERIPTIVFTTGHQELDGYHAGDLAYELSKMYEVGQISLDNNLNSLMRRVAVDSTTSKMIPNFDMVIIAKPQKAFTMKELFILDQYVMHGGKIVWGLDMVAAEMDSLRYATSTLGMPMNLELDELLFRYGVRVNKNLVLNANAMEIGTGERVLRTWDYFPIALPVKGHPITQNLNAISTHFVNNIDTVGSATIKKQVLLKTDHKTRINPAPALIDLVDIIYRGPNPALYNRPAQNIAVMLEGSFTSVFENRVIDPRIMANKALFDIQYKSPQTSQLVIADGDILRNQLRETQNGVMPYPLGYDRYSKKMYDNRKFMLNAVNYMLDDHSLIVLRNKQYKIRLLNKDTINNERLRWQLINTSIPISIIVLLGIVLGLIKRNRFTKQN